MARATLILKDGSVFHGTSYGAKGIVCGEVVFNTSMTGYQEIITDCSYSGQILTLTYPQIGNVGVNKNDMESDKICIAGLVIRELSSVTSNWRAEQSLRNFLKKNETIVITDLDTRALTKKLREKGSMVGCITSGKFSKKQIFSKIENFNYSKLKIKNNYCFSSSILLQEKDNSLCYPYNVIVFDFGVKKSILQCLKDFNCKTTIISTADGLNDVLKLNPEGIVLSNGPGNPKFYKNIISIVKELINTNTPILGICLGHQLIALALGADTIKMKYGHHGANHPVQDLNSRKVLMTSQNHNFIVDGNSLPKDFIITHCSLFDGTIQGFRHISKPIYGFQGHPEAGPGPNEGKIIFDSFINSIKTRRNLCQNVQI